MTPPVGPAPLAVGPGVDRAALVALLSRIGLAGMPLVGIGDPAGAVVLLGGITADILASALRQPHRAFVEFGGPADGLPERLLPRPAAEGFCLSVRTATAFGIESARLVCEALCQRGALPEAMRFPVEIALHEVVANAILHGNLGIESALKANPEQYESFCEQLQARLADPDRRERWIDIRAAWNDRHLEIAVADEGQGYAVGSTPRSADHDGSFGRGLGIVRDAAAEITVSDGGRRTVLRFDYET